MGLDAIEAVRILQLCTENGIQNKSLCMMGKQGVWTDWNSFIPIASRYGFQYNKEFLEKVREKSNDKVQVIDGYDFFKVFGFTDIHALDVSPYEDADIIFNLMDDLPGELYQKFDYVIDGGTLEHVFDSAKAIKNMANMVKKGGYIIHLAPIEGWVNHGFYSFSPDLFLEFYQANGFHIKNLELRFRFNNKRNPLAFFSQDCRALPMPINEYIDRIKTLQTDDEHMETLSWFVAKKTQENAADLYPIQGFYQATYQRAKTVLKLRHDWPKDACNFLEKNKDKQIALYGAGHACDLLLNELFKNGLDDSIQYILSSYIEMAGSTYRGYKMYYPTRKRLEAIDLILICNTFHVDEIFHVLESLGPDIVAKTYKLSQIVPGNEDNASEA